MKTDYVDIQTEGEGMTSFYSEQELKELGLAQIGKNVRISRKASIYGAENIWIESNVRIDDFCILSGNIRIGNYVHIAAYSALFGGKSGIEMKDFVSLSSRGVIYAESDDYSGAYLTNPTIPDQYRNVVGGKVVLEKHVIIGTGSSIMPALTIGEGTAVGSMSLVTKDLEEWGIYAGIPCRRIKERRKDLITLEKKVSDV